MPGRRNRRSKTLAAALAALGFASVAFAAPPVTTNAPIKWVDAQGRVHYTDRRPLPDTAGRIVATPSIAAHPAPPSMGDPTLPWALRSAAARYPVILYTSKDCAPCELARAHLAERGVPYTEKRVEDAADVRAFHSLGFADALFPSVTIGPEKLTGYEATGWNRALDATGYPRTSMLPAKRDPRTVEPMLGATRHDDAVSGQASAELLSNAPAAQAAARDGEALDTDRLLSPSSFQTGPNPIRF